MHAQNWNSNARLQESSIYLEEGSPTWCSQVYATQPQKSLGEPISPLSHISIILLLSDRITDVSLIDCFIASEERVLLEGQWVHCVKEGHSPWALTKAPAKRSCIAQ